MRPTEINEILNEINIRLDKIDDKEISAAISALLQLRDAAEDKTISEEEMQILLNQLFPDPLKGKNNRARIMEAAAIASYHQQTEIPVIRVLLSDDAPQFKKFS